MKKIFAFVLAMLMLLSITACGGADNTTGSTNGATNDNGTTAPTGSVTDPTNATLPQLNLSEVYTTIIAGANMPDMYGVNAEQMLDLYGIRQEHCNQAVVYLCVNSLRTDEIWLLEAKDAAAMETLKGLVISRLDQKDAESVTYSPEQNAVVKAAIVMEIGNYLAMIVSPDAQVIADAFRTALGI